MNKCRLSLAVVILILAWDASACGADDARAIVAKAVQACGGEDALRLAQAQHLYLKGTFHFLEEQPTFTTEEFFEHPRRFKTVTRFKPAGTPALFIEVFDGKKGWSRTNDECHEETDLVSFRQEAFKTDLAYLLGLLEKGVSLSVVGEEKSPEGKAVQVLVKSQGQPDFTLAFERNSGLLVRIAYRGIDGENKKEVLKEEFLSDYREANPVALDEQALRAAKVVLEDAALLDYLQKRTIAGASQEAIQEMIQRLGDGSFEVREKAKKDLMAQGSHALPQLQKATKNSDPEVAEAARECLKQIGPGVDSQALTPVLRILARRRPSGVVETLAAYLASAPNDVAREEVLGCLYAVAFRDGKPDPALEKIVAGKDPQARAVALTLLGRDGKKPDQLPGRRLFLFSLKHAGKGTQFMDGKKVLSWEMTEVRYYTKLPDATFAKP